MANNMSKDRVRFYIQKAKLVSGSSCGLWKVLEETLGLTRDIARVQLDCLQFDEYLEIVCRPSQFTRFLITRNDAGLRNGFKELKPELFFPVSTLQPIDVSRNPARRC